MMIWFHFLIYAAINWVAYVLLMHVLPIRRDKQELKALEQREKVDRYYHSALDSITVARLACGARVLRLDRHHAYLLRNGVEEGKRELLREGNLVVLCVNSCVLCNGCPRIEDYIKVEDAVVNDEFCESLIDQDYPADMKRHLAGVEDGNGEKKAIPTPLPRFKGFLVNTKDRRGLIVAPVLLEVDDGNDSRDGDGEV